MRLRFIRKGDGIKQYQVFILASRVKRKWLKNSFSLVGAEPALGSFRDGRRIRQKAPNTRQPPKLALAYFWKPVWH
jgi:hypothetical protein